MESKWNSPKYFKFSFESWHLWASAIFLFGLGLIASFLLQEDWFSRSGAMTIAFLLGVFSLDPRKDPEFEENLENSIFPGAGEVDSPYQVSSASVRKYYNEELRARLVLRAEAQIAALATLVWGFGDIILNGVSKTC